MSIETISTRKWITALLILSFIPLILLPPTSFSMTSQEWWLPVLLMGLALVAAIQLVFRNNDKTWPWDLLAFSQGFNIISRLLLLMPHATVNFEGNPVFNTAYVLMSVVSMVFSAFLLWYMTLPSVRIGLLKE